VCGSDLIGPPDDVAADPQSSCAGSGRLIARLFRAVECKANGSGVRECPA